MIKIVNWLKCKLLNKHDFPEKSYPENMKIPGRHYYDSQLLTCKNCGKKEFR